MSLTADQRAVLDYAVEHSGGASISLAVEGGANATSAFILNSDANVIGMGGYTGSDNAPSVDQLEQWTADGELRFVLGSGSGGPGGFLSRMGGGAATERSEWISGHCTEVPASAYGGSSAEEDTGSSGMMGAGTTLYDCAAAPPEQEPATAERSR
ncbi:hypothetical protein GCM10020295_01630 [Streptomyces cinereospinus]